MTQSEFLQRTRNAPVNAELYVLLANGDWVLVTSVEIATTQAILMHPQRPLAEVAP